MTTEELILMLDKFNAEAGKFPTKIICGATAFKKLRCEALDALNTNRHLEPYAGLDYPATFMGIPIQVIRSRDPLEDDKIYVLSEPDENFHNPVDEAWYVRRTLDDFAVHYYGNWDTAAWNTTTSKNACYRHLLEEDIPDISEDALMSVLNGGGFNAVT